MTSFIKEIVSRNFRNPENGIGAYLVEVTLSTVFTAIIKEIVSRNLRNPEKGIGAYLVEKFFVKRSTKIIKLTVSKANIEPDHMVLEVGFGPGIGLTEASKRIKDGKGKVYGIDISQAMLESATHKLEKQIASGKVNLAIGDVMSLPFEENTFDRIFHTNCFYFWPEPLTCAKELRRVMKPEALMITGMNVAGVQKVKGDGYMKYGNPDLEMYLETLKSAGYSEIVREDIKHEGNEVVHTFIYASPNKC